MDFHHISVLMEETIENLVTKPEGVYVDCTLGGCGHALKVIERLNEKAWFIGIDQDPTAISVAKERLAGAKCRIDIVNSNFSNLVEVLNQLKVESVDGFLFDLGVSSHQLDKAERGFSYMQDARLDMRMNPNDSLSAYEVVNKYEEENLATLILKYGEERWAKRIAKFIVAERKVKAIETTGELVEIIKKAIPAAARKEGGHPAKRTFQAIRIEVNNELNILENTFKVAVDKLAKKGRICVITFHSLEDRITKQTFQSLGKGCICPPRLPMCVCNLKPKVKIIGKPMAATEKELNENSRAKSAKLRVAEKL